jgi:hypothetical protein
MLIRQAIHDDLLDTVSEPTHIAHGRDIDISLMTLKIDDLPDLPQQSEDSNTGSGCNTKQNEA